MQARFLAVLFVLVLPLSLTAQNPNRIEIFGGYSHVGYGIYQQYSGPWVSSSFNGWEASAAAQFVSHVAAEVDFAYAYSPTYHYNLNTIMGGPHVSAKLRRVSFYGHALFGALTFNSGGLTNTATSFSFVLGGGGDLWFSRHIGARLIQFDYLHNNNQAAVIGFEPINTPKNGPGNSYRIATGIVFRFGH